MELNRIHKDLVGFEIIVKFCYNEFCSDSFVIS